MPDRPRNVGASVRQRLLNLAHARGQPMELLLTRYAQMASRAQRAVMTGCRTPILVEAVQVMGGKMPKAMCGALLDHGRVVLTVAPDGMSKVPVVDTETSGLNCLNSLG